MSDRPLTPDIAQLIESMRADVLTHEEVQAARGRLGPVLGTSRAMGRGPRFVSRMAMAAAAGFVVAAGVLAAAAASRRHAAVEAPASIDPVPRVDVPLVTPTTSVPPAPAETATVSPHALPARPAARVGSEAPQPTAAVTEASQTGAELAEHQLLVDARRAIASDPARALSLADQHKQRFPSGLLAPERELIAIDALVALGNTDAAQARAEAFARRWPSSYAVERLRKRGLLR